MFIIHAPGIYLPNGEFVENCGHGHGASALKIITSQRLNNEWRNSGRNVQDFLVYNNNHP